MTDIALGTGIPSVIHIRNIASYSLGYEIIFRLDISNYNIISGSMQEKPLIVSLLGHTLHQASKFLVVVSRIEKPQK